MPQAGVEDFTDSCGTGSCACGVVAVLRGGPSCGGGARNPGGMNLVGCRIQENKAVSPGRGGGVCGGGVWETEGA